MRLKIFFIVILFLLLVLCTGSITFAADSSQERVHKLLKYIDDLWRGDSSFAAVSMEVMTTHYMRSMKMDVWSKGKNHTLVKITSPLKEKGTSTLKSDNNIFTYLPRTDRTIRLTSGMMSGAWMGSHFTNDDLVKESRREQDYNSNITYEGERDGKNIVEITLKPKKDSAVVWGKVVLTIKKENHVPLTEVFYDEDMHISRTFSYSEIKTVNGKPCPMVMRVVPADKPEEFTQLKYSELKLNISVKDSFFSMSNLKRI